MKKFAVLLVHVSLVTSAWSQSGEEILYTSVRDGVKELWIMNIVSGKERRLTDDGNDYESPALSPDGRSIVFLRRESRTDPNTQEVYIMNSDGKNVRRLTDNQQRDFTPAWSADGRQIYFTRKNSTAEQIVRISTDGSNEEVLTDASSSNVMPRPSNDGKFIIYHSYRHGEDNPEQYRMDLATRKEQRLTNSPGWDYESSFSPDDKWISFSSNRHGGKAEIYVMSADGGAVKQLTSINSDSWNSSFSRDGKRILFYSGTSDHWQMYVMNADGTDLKKFGNEKFSNYGCQWIK